MNYISYSRNGLVSAALVALLLTANPVMAQTATTTSTMIPAPVVCSVPARNLYRGLSDNALGDVTTLQQFLSTEGYFSVTPTGYFGPITFRAVQSFQASQGVSNTGYFGPLTRAAMRLIACPASSVSVWSLSPATGSVGTLVSITGFGFTSSNTVLMDGLVAAKNVPISSSIAIACTTSPLCHGGINQTIQFTIPTSLSSNCPVGSMCPMFLREVTPATYSVTVQNANGTSNALTLTVAGSSSTGAPTITGLDTPATLALGQSGTWTVHASLPSNSTSNLHYSVVWGDEVGMTTGNSFKAPESTTLQTSATFTHTYQHSGTYTPIFTVTNDAGASVTTSASIVVTPLY